MNKRIVIVGTSGSGKTTLARALSTHLTIPHIELDQLYWGPNWSLNPDFKDQVSTVLRIPQWIVCGNYSKIQDLTWAQATHIIWLDYSLRIALWRALKRSIVRISNNQKICGDNVETLRRLLSRNSILLWVIQTHASRRHAYQTAFAQQQVRTCYIRVKSQKDLDDKIAQIF